MQLPELLDECASLGIKAEAEMGKWKVIDLLLERARQTPEVFGVPPNKRFTGLPLPWEQTERLPFAAGGSLRRIPQGRMPKGAPAPAPALPDPERVSRPRQTYARIVDVNDVAKMLVAAHAEDVAILHVGTRCTWTDFMVIATARSEPHLAALAGAAAHFFSQARKRAIEAGDPAAASLTAAVEGPRSAVQRPDWLVVDMDSVVVHMLTRSMRAEYALEELWGVTHGCRVEYVSRDSAAGIDGDPTFQTLADDADDGVDEEGGVATEAGDGRWQPVVYDKKAKAFRPYYGDSGPPTSSAARETAASGVVPPDGQAQDDSGSDTEVEQSEEPEELSAEQLVALKRYDQAHAVINAREELRQRREDERAAARRKQSLTLAQNRRTRLDLRRRKSEIRQAAKKMAGGPDEEPRVKAPNIGIRIRALRDALQRGVHFGLLGSTDNVHSAGCTCVACALVSSEAEKLASSARGKETLTEAPTAQRPACSSICTCDVCRWARQRIRNMVLASPRDIVNAAGLSDVRRALEVQRRKAASVALTLTMKASKATRSRARTSGTATSRAVKSEEGDTASDTREGRDEDVIEKTAAAAMAQKKRYVL